MENTEISEEYAKSSNCFKAELDRYDAIVKRINEINSQITEDIWAGNLADVYRKSFNEFAPNFETISKYLSKSSDDYDKALNNILDQDEGVYI